MLTANSSFRRVIRLLAACTFMAGAVALLGSPTAAAHVSANAETAVPGEQTIVSFRVPNESESASTVRIKVAFPADHPLPRAAPQAVAGWTVKINSEKLDKPVGSDGEPVTEAVTSIVWSGGEIPPGQFQEFPVRVGPLPQGVNELVFKAVQSYSDGEVVRWIDEPEQGQSEPEHPAPTLAIEAPAEHAEEHATEGGDALARTLGAGGLIAGLVALGFAIAGRARRSHQPPAANQGVEQQQETASV